MTHFCLNCGHNFTRDEPVIRDRWELGPHWTKLDGKPMPITVQQSAILYTVAASERGVKTDALLMRVSDTCNGNVVQAQLSRLRKLFGALMPVKFKPGAGYQWVSAA